MKRVHILVEGQTEETFIRDVLTPHLSDFDVHLSPVIISTKRVKSGLKFKGGVSKYRPVKLDLQRLLGDSGAVAVTTMIDFYGLPGDFPGFATLPRRGSCYQQVAHLEAALRSDLEDPRLLPYLSLHEFEALLLAAPVEIGSTFPGGASTDPLEALVRSVGSPEEIDDGPETHPAARILRLVPSYRKRLHGPLIASRIGLEALRRRCPHFDRWVASLEDFG